MISSCWLGKKSRARRSRAHAAASGTTVRLRTPCAPWINTPSMSAVSLDGNPLVVAEDDMLKVKAVKTFKEGKSAYQRQGA